MKISIFLAPEYDGDIEVGWSWLKPDEPPVTDGQFLLEIIEHEEEKTAVALFKEALNKWRTVYTVHES